MPREADIYLEDILIAIERIQSYTRNLDRSAFFR
jgi:uncharacterized protein with HEPN domain